MNIATQDRCYSLVKCRLGSVWPTPVENWTMSLDWPACRTADTTGPPRGLIVKMEHCHSAVSINVMYIILFQLHFMTLQFT